MNYDVILDDLKKKFNPEKFKNLDKELEKIIYDNRYLELLPSSNLIKELDEKLSEILGEKKQYEISKKNDANVIKEFAILCEVNNEKFYLSRTFKAYIQMSMLKGYLEDIGIDLLKYIKHYLDYTNKEYLMINARTAYFIINATRIKRYKGYRKVSNILKQFKLEFDISKYKDIIANRIKLNRVEFFDFIREVNKVKIATGIIPFEICEYLICEMLNPDSTISKDYKFWADLRECVFCDFISHMQIKQYKVYDYFNYSKKLEDVRGKYRHKNKTICIDEDVIYSFSSINVKAINTIMHELIHFKQYFCIDKNDYSEFNYEILKEDIAIDNITNFKKKNSWYLSKEIEARRKAIENAICYLQSLGCNINNLKIYYKTDTKSECISLLEYKKIVFEDYELSLLEKEYLNPKLNFSKKINIIIKSNAKLIMDKPILKYEYNDDGTKKRINEIIELLETALENKALPKESVKGIFKYSTLSNYNIAKFHNIVKEIINHQYNNEKNRKMFFDVLVSIVTERKNRLKFINDLEKRAELETLLTNQLENIENYK